MKPVCRRQGGRTSLRPGVCRLPKQDVWHRDKGNAATPGSLVRLPLREATRAESRKAAQRQETPPPRNGRPETRTRAWEGRRSDRSRSGRERTPQAQRRVTATPDGPRHSLTRQHAGRGGCRRGPCSPGEAHGSGRSAHAAAALGSYRTRQTDPARVPPHENVPDSTVRDSLRRGPPGAHPAPARPRRRRRLARRRARVAGGACCSGRAGLGPGGDSLPSCVGVAGVCSLCEHDCYTETQHGTKGCQTQKIGAV